MMSASFGRSVVIRHATMVGSLCTKVTKVAPLAAAGAAFLLRAQAGPGLPGAASARSFSGSPVSFVATKKKTTTAAAAKKKKPTTSARGKTAAAKKKTATKKPVAKKKTAVKKKKAAPKKKKKVAAKRTKRTKRVLTPEQKEARLAKLKDAKRIARVKELKATAMLKEEPRSGAVSPWVVFANAHGPDLRVKGVPFSQVFTQLSEQFKTLSEAEMEKLRSAGKTNHEAYVARYEAWIKQHTPAQILAANKARASLKRMGLKTRSPLRDSRAPKRNISSWLFYASEKLKARPENTAVADAMKEASVQWKSLSPAQKRPYEEMATQDKKRWEQQSKVAFGS